MGPTVLCSTSTNGERARMDFDRVFMVTGVRRDPNRAVHSTAIHRLSLTKRSHILG